MASFPWGMLLTIPVAWFLFLNKGRFLAATCHFKRHGLLWFLFLMLLGGFFNLTTGQGYFNLGGIMALVLGGRLFFYSTNAQRLRIGLAALAIAVFIYCFETGVFWWLIRWPVASAWLLPLISVLLALSIAGGLRQAWAGLIIGLVAGQAIASLTVSYGIYFEVGSFAVLNSLFIMMAGAALLDWLMRGIKLRPEQLASPTLRSR